MKFKEIRNSKGLTLQQVGNSIGLSARTVMRIEGGERKPKADVMFQLAALYGCSVNDFYGEPDPPPAPAARSRGSGASSRKSDK